MNVLRSTEYTVSMTNVNADTQLGSGKSSVMFSIACQLQHLLMKKYFACMVVSRQS